MIKNYNKFYEINNNKYYTITVDDEMYIASESFLKLDKKYILRKQKELITGFKVLKFSPSIAQLFNALNDLKKSEHQRYDCEELTIYEDIDNKQLKENIKNAYQKAVNDEIFNLSEQQAKFINENKPELAESCKHYIEAIKRVNPMEGISLEEPKHTGCVLIKTMLREGLNHLYTERVNAFANNVYMYEQDEFGNLTIYKIITVKNVVKSIDTFIYDKKLVECLLKTLYEKGR